jgi:hypothetical protein
VSVGVGEFAEKLEWLPSVVRLVPLEKCEMFIGYAPQVPGAVLNECLWRAFKRKLDAIRDSARILLSNSTSEIIERVAVAARELASHDSNFAREDVARLRKDIDATIVGEDIRIGMNDMFPEPVHVFVCPMEETLDFFELIQGAASFASAGISA